MPILSILAYIGASLGIAGQEADSVSTYYGVKKFGPSVEGDKAWFAQFSVNHPSTLWYLKALVFGTGEGLLLYAGPYTNGGGYFIAMALGIMGAIQGFDAAYQNYKDNHQVK